MNHTRIVIDINTYAPFDPADTAADRGFRTFQSLLDHIDSMLEDWPIEFEDWKVTVE